MTMKVYTMEMWMAAYTIERLQTPEDFTPEVIEFLTKELYNVNALFDHKYDFGNWLPYEIAKRGYVLLCRRDGEIRGLMLAFLTKSPFDTKLTILQQQLFYVMPESGRTAYHLFKKFIDIGKSQADYINSAIGNNTNIKPETLKRMGFKEAETLYIMDVKDE